MAGELSVPIERTGSGLECNSIYRKRIRGLDHFLTALIDGCACLTILILAAMIGYVLIRGIPNISWSFLTTESSAVRGTSGILGNIINTLYIVFLTLLIAAPVGVGAAVYLNEYAKPGRLVRVMEFTMEVLAGIPSIIFGLFGMAFFGTAMGLGYSVLTGALTLSLIVLPLITRTTQEALKTVPVSYREGAAGLGAAGWRTIRTILLPCAAPGIFAGLTLAAGRMISESAALLFTAGSGYRLPQNLFSKVMESGGTLTVQLYLSMQKAEYAEAFAIASVLLILALAINSLAGLLSRRFHGKEL